MSDEQYIDIAIEISKSAKYPYGAIVVKDNEIIGRSDDKTLMETSMYSHAELEAIESASKNKNLYGDLKGATIYVSCEPCMMCMGAILYEEFSKVVYAATLQDSNDNYCPEMITNIDELAKYSKNKIEIVKGLHREKAVEILKARGNSMDRIIMLGTGNGGTMDLYNTCFTIQNEKGNFLIDTGGSIEIIKRLNQADIDYKSIRHIFISHSHTDHILGIFWLFKKISRNVMHGDIKERINIYCNDVVLESIKEVSKYILPDKLMEAIYSIVDFRVLNDGDKYNINGIDYTFFDIKARGTKQFGFECSLNGKRLAFLGDETLNPNLYDRIKDFDYVMHEAFCLDSEENIFHAYEKNHSTTRSVSEVMNKLEVKNLILYHTEDSHKEKRKELYTNEAQTYFNGKVIVPNDLEIIEIN